jgi:photosystem II stability/assembly factor-like uncharacterized protein
MPRWTLIAALAALSACDALENAWSITEHPCIGNRTDTLWFDDADTVWVGCGSTTLGTGLYRSTDGGRTWSAPSTDPAGFFDDFRVSSISRSADEVLYAAGTGGTARVVSVASGANPMTVTEVFVSQGQLWNGFHVGTFRRNSAGLAAAESLTGADLAFRTGDTDPWQDGYGWWTSGTSFQILDMVLHGDDFYACGSTISQPPTVFLPPAETTSGFTLDPVTVSDTVSGELWGIAVDSSGIAAGGVDQDEDVGMVFTGDLTARDTSDWTAFAVSDLHTDPTWVRGVCRDGNRIVAVGEFSMQEDGLVLESDDGGTSWSDITPTDAPALHRCTILGDGTLAVTGADGFFAKR